MPENSGWNAGRNLLISQVETEYALTLDDDFYFARGTNINLMLEFLEGNAYYDLVAGVVGNRPKGNTQSFGAKPKGLFWSNYNRLIYNENSTCLIHKPGILKNFPSHKNLWPKNVPKPKHSSNIDCKPVDMTINFYLARTSKLREISHDLSFKNFAHKEFFIDARGKLAIAQCNLPLIGHNKLCKQMYSKSSKIGIPKTDGEYSYKREASGEAWIEFLKRWYFRNGLDWAVMGAKSEAPHGDYGLIGGNLSL